MELTSLNLYFAPYLTGVVFGFVYAFLFVDVKLFKESFSKINSFLVLISLSFVYLFSYPLFWSSWLDLRNWSHLSLGYLGYVFLSILCLLSALYLFGAFNSKDRSNRFVSTAKRPGIGFMNLFLDVHFVWLSSNSVVFSQLFYQSYFSMVMSLLGFFTSIFFIGFQIQHRSG